MPFLNFFEPTPEVIDYMYSVDIDENQGQDRQSKSPPPCQWRNRNFLIFTRIRAHANPCIDSYHDIFHLRGCPQAHTRTGHLTRLSLCPT